MYSTCLFCHGSLGANEAIEHLPIGRRLAFDPAKGRLWVVCRRCERWNLTPIEERWEAIEECERAFGGTKLRVSTDNVGLARLREGLELVRIGAPQRPELAAWRYGDQFGRRRRKAIILSGVAVVGVGGLMAIGPATGLIGVGAIWQAPNLVNNAISLYNARRIRARISVPEHPSQVVLRKADLQHVGIEPTPDGWGLRVRYGIPGDKAQMPHSTRVLGLRPTVPARHFSLLTGDEAVRVAGQLLPLINSRGAPPSKVAEAVDLLEATPDARKLFNHITRLPIRVRNKHRTNPGPGARIKDLPSPMRLALEMISHEDAERRAMEGELAELENAWRDAEEIAAIADDMFLPEDTQRALDALKRKP